MLENREFLLVDAQALPEVFLKVVQAKRYLAQGKAKNASHAAQLAGKIGRASCRERVLVTV